MYARRPSLRFLMSPTRTRSTERYRSLSLYLPCYYAKLQVNSVCLKTTQNRIVPLHSAIMFVAEKLFCFRNGKMMRAESQKISILSHPFYCPPCILNFVLVHIYTLHMNFFSECRIRRNRARKLSIFSLILKHFPKICVTVLAPVTDVFAF